MKHRRRRHHRGYILIVTLGALTLAAMLMMVLARSAIDQTRAARSAADDLQHRWGTISCREAILPHAEQILAAAEARHGAPLVFCEAAVRLGDSNISMIISDEQAKANVNTILATADQATSEDRLHRVIAETGLPMQLRLRPVVDPTLATTQSSIGQVSGWGQVTNGSDAGRLIPCSELLTCWGDGRINLARASAPAITLAAPALLQTDIRHVIEARSHVSGSPSANIQGESALTGLLQAAQIDPSHASGLTVGSTCHGLWIVAHDGRRVWYDLAIRDESNSDAPRVRCFSW
jgi:Tfp pilus assembly protein PilX